MFSENVVPYCSQPGNEVSVDRTIRIPSSSSYRTGEIYLHGNHPLELSNKCVDSTV